MIGICIPHRGREAYLATTMQHVRRYVKDTGDYRFYVGDQVDGGLFNLSMARNVAALAAIDDGCDHLVFQDVDLMPLCGASYAANGIEFWFLSAGGVKLPAATVLKVNGWNPHFAGWGWEDTEFHTRITRLIGQPIDWPKSVTGRVTVIRNLDLHPDGTDWRDYSQRYFQYQDSGPLYQPMPAAERNFPFYDRGDWLVASRSASNREFTDQIGRLPTELMTRYFAGVGMNLIDKNRLQQRRQDDVLSIRFDPKDLKEEFDYESLRGHVLHRQPFA